ncbi:MAG TPA: TRAP transporter permease [Aminivibrio sp.]|jgi:TRAP transporter 4TM/12TM fusion protein|uniref:TRAP transporter permease n=1 Tax=Aminivibrio sp. TaxID=1872489 RepID=UPI002BA826FD|nr:TRAP transporter permease [Aminivibrio sp.]HPF84463.1 TRAP transporter permease [Aminivibrio sp.]HRX25197.1 TRAP transporter permease [Aminivibrio sp.]
MKKLLSAILPGESIPTRKLNGTAGRAALVLTVSTALVHFWMNSIGLLIAIKMNAIHLGTLMAIIFLFYPAFAGSPRERPSMPDWVLAGISLGCMVWLLITYDRLLQTNLQATFADLAVAVVTMALLVEASRRAVGLPLTVLSLLFLAYTRLGPYFPGLFAHRGFNWERIIIRMALTDQGIYGVTLMVSSSYVFMFILFGAFLAASRTSEFFNDFSLALAGRYRGGPAKVAVVASALMGSISGSAQANVATTGAFTIPLMKRVGYMPHFAGAVEAAASTGGILMPPIMGASAFIMSTFLGIPYVKIMIAGFTPALLYYLAIMFMVDLRAKKRGLKGMEPGDIPSLKATMLDKGHMTIPLVVIIYLLVAGYTPLYSAFLGLFAIVLVSSLKRSTRMGIREVIEALDSGTRSAAPVGISCAIVGFIVGAVGMTGLGQVIAMNVIMFAGGKLWAALILCMIAAIILGMGLPATPCYIITATIAAPALQQMGVHPLAAHFFAFYYGTMSAVVPPVALTSYTAAGLAGARPFKVAVSALGLALSGLLLPYLFVYNPDLLFIDFVLPKYLLDVVTAIIGVFSLSCGIIGMFKRDMSFLERALFILAGILMVNPLRILRISSFVFFAALVARHWFSTEGAGRGEPSI